MKARKGPALNLCCPDGYPATLSRCTSKTLTLHRNPTPYEIRFGEGAVHYKDFDRELLVKRDGTLKAWVVCPHAALRYYRT